MMRNLLLCAVILSMAAILTAGVNVQYNLQAPKITTGTQYTEVLLKDAQNWGEPGLPALPWYGVKVLLPAGFEAEQISVNRSNPIVYALEKPKIGRAHV